jgi:hypothetical protein
MKHLTYSFLAAVLAATVLAPASVNAEEQRLHVPIAWFDLPRVAGVDQHMGAKLPGDWAAVFTRSGQSFRYDLGDASGVDCAAYGQHGVRFEMRCTRDAHVGHWELVREAGAHDASLDWVFDDAPSVLPKGEPR